MIISQKDLQFNLFTVNGSELVAQVVSEGIRCKTWPTLPRKLDIIVSKTTELYLREFEKISDEFYLKGFSTYDELYSWLKENLLAIPEIKEMNLTQAEFDAGVKVEDNTRSRFAFTSAYSNDVTPSDDFVDLDAFIRGICHNLIRRSIDIDFNSFRTTQ